jgi:anti-sigma factor RsiW
VTCRDFIDFLAAYLARELPPEQQSEFARHVAACPPCINYLRTYEATILLERSSLCAADDEVPPDVPRELLAAVLAARRKAGQSGA